MTLGEKICALRGKQNLSQGDLADRLGVSRQSVSKWETDASVPELDKLIKLCQTFQVSLDELVQGDTAPKEKEVPPPPPPSGGAGVQTRQVLGIVLLGIAGVVFLLITFMVGDVLGALILCSPFLGCGAICLLVKRHTGLCCLWLLWVLLVAYFRYATGVRPWWAFSPQLYILKMFTQIIVAWAEILTLAALLGAALMRIKKKKKP